MKKADAIIGTRVIVMRNSNHSSYTIDKTYIVHDHYDSISCYLKDPDTGYVGNCALYDDIELADRKSQAKALLSEATKLETRAAALRAKAERLTKYKDDTEELACLIAETLKAGSEPAKIYEVLSKFGVKASLL